MESPNPLITLYGKVYGPLYFSSLMSTGLYGITCMQTFFYYVHYPNDSLPMKSFVAVLWALDTVHEALTVAGVYKYIIAGLVNPLAALDANPELALQILSETLVSTPVQAFFVYRIYICSGKNIVAPLLWVTQAIYQIVVSVLYVAKAFYCVNGSIRVVEAMVLDDKFFAGVVASCLVLSALVDVLIAIAMTYLLVRMRNATIFSSTAHILQRLTVFAVNTGTWTAMFAVLSLVLLLVFPSTFFHALPAIPLCSLYCNTLLANLNARAYVRNGWTAPMFGETKAESLSDMAFVSPLTRQTTGMVVPIDVDVSETTTAENSA